jgi:allantoinase
MLVSNPRIPYRLAGNKTRLPPFGDKRILVQLVVNMEHWRFDHPMPRGISTPPQGRHSVPDVPNFAWAEYGMRVGMQRIFELFESRGLPATASINANVIDIYPECAEKSLKLDWEFIGHGLYQQAVHTEEDERAVIAASLDRLQAFTGSRTRGWLGPGLGESAATPDHLRELGIDYLLDWVLDDQPCWMTTKHGPMLSMPYSLELNDSTIYAIERHATGEFANRLKRSLLAWDRIETIDTRVLTVALHPHLVGVPHRLTELAEMIDLLQAHSNVAFVRPAEIADWYTALVPAQEKILALAEAK